MKLQALICPFLAVLFGYAGASTASSLMETKPSDVYVAPPGTELVLDSDRPTTQFVSPNDDSMSDLFPSFKVALLSNTEAIAFVTAEAPVRSLQECNSKLGTGYRIISEYYQGFSNTPPSDSQLGGSNEFSKSGEDVYFVYECVKGYGPYWTLHFQVRSQAQDSALKAPWDAYFESRR